jgi:UDP-N-acetylmuramoyl-L-alanyl-D-glutamate--2,6-diaminopimelate ligase
LTFGLNKKSDIKAENIFLSPQGIKFDLCIGNKRIPIESNLIAKHNVYNILGAIAVAYLEGIDLGALREFILSFKGVPGRLQRIDCGQPYYIFVDYAHTPAALESVLRNLKEFVNGRIIIVFGCGGNRDRQKRPVMGEIADRLTDIVILTDDNPREENAFSIIQEIKSGIRRLDKLKINPDRKEAIKLALSLAKEGDCILIAGKGHENYQLIKKKRIKFNDVEIVRDLLKTALC